MAAQYFYCTQCHKKYPTHHKLFDTLYDFSKIAPEDCPACGGMRELHITLDFQLGVGDEQEEVTFYPFLVVLEGGVESKQFCWMPYWHVVGKEARYGQHAVCLDQTQFESLIAQVQDKVLEPV